jgi:Fe-S cluster biogenesis protein NfuA
MLTNLLLYLWYVGAMLLQIVLDNEDGAGHFLSKTDPIENILKSPLATDLFKVDGVKAVYFGGDFVTVTKRAEAKWQFMRPEIFSVLMDFFENPDNKVLLDKPLITDTTILEDDDEIVAMIKELIEDRIRPAVQEDGGDIHYRNFEEDTGLVTVQLAGSCVGCPSSSITLKQGVENMLMHYIPEVTAVVAQEEEDDGEENDDDGAAFGEEPQKQKTYEERLAAAGIPFSD